MPAIKLLPFPFHGSKFQIRLLRLSPRTATPSNATLAGKRSGPLLQGSLEVFDFDLAPPFVGLSYVWGSEEDKQPFLLNGDEVQITKNLAIALEHLRDEHQEVTLWADALCIDQCNDQEKSDQVSRMRDIYKRADSVRIWLGPSSDRIDVLMDFFEDASRMLVGMGMQTSNLSSPPWDSNELKESIAENTQYLEGFLSEEFGNYSEALTDLVTREWWFRVWTLQEFVVAKDVVFQCGKRLSKLEVFQVAVVGLMHLMSAIGSNDVQIRDWVQLTQDYSYQPGRGEMWLMWITIFQRFHLRHAYMDTQDPSRHTMGYFLKTLYKTAVNGREPKATDPKDKIYALLGLARDSDSLGIVPDYKKSVRDIYTEVAGKVIAKDGLSLLLTCKYNPSSGLPSWVPDFRQGLIISLNDLNGLERGFCAGSTGKVTYGAKPLDGSPNILGVKGSCVGRVLDIGASVSSFDFRAATRFISEIEGFLLQSAFMDLCPYGASYDDYQGHDPIWLQKARYRVPVADYQCSADHPITRATASSKVGFDSLMAVCRQYEDMMGQGQSPSPAQVASLMRGFGDSVSYLLLLRMNSGRKSFITTNGYVGVGPEEMEVGDDVFIISGATVPYVLRAAQGSGRLILIGDAYVYGIMDGELMGKHPLRDLELE